jgi:hypothetical protein
MTSIFSDSENEWLERRARKIARETGVPLPIARSAAMAELVRLREKPKADVVELLRTKPRDSR